MKEKKLEKLNIKRLLGQIALLFFTFYLIGRIFGMKGVIIGISSLIIYRIIKIFVKGEDIFKKLVGVGVSIMYITLLILSKIYKEWFGFWGLIAVFIFLLGIRLYHLFKGWSPLRGLMVDFCKIIEKQKFGRDLDDPYWDTHKKPTFIEHIKGTYVPKDKNGVIIENEIEESNTNKSKI